MKDDDHHYPQENNAKWFANHCEPQRTGYFQLYIFHLVRGQVVYYN